MTRRVVVIFGPPGAGKTTLANTLGLEVYDRDDPIWNNDEARFRDALRRIGQDPTAQAAVIRTGATLRARSEAATLCRATETQVLDTEADVCIERIRSRKRGDVRSQIAGVKSWWKNYEPDSAVQVTAGATSRRW